MKTKRFRLCWSKSYEKKDWWRKLWTLWLCFPWKTHFCNSTIALENRRARTRDVVKRQALRTWFLQNHLTWLCLRYSPLTSLPSKKKKSLQRICHYYWMQQNDENDETLNEGWWIISRLPKRRKKKRTKRIWWIIRIKYPFYFSRLVGQSYVKFQLNDKGFKPFLSTKHHEELVFYVLK